jgi:hypothetical protein
MSLATSSAEQTRFARGIALAALVAAIVNFIAFYPGLLHHDAWAYFRAVRANDWTNWQPPLLGFLWIPLQKIYYGPQPMLVLFVAAYWAGFALLAIAFAERDRRLAVWTFVAAFFPLAINFNGQLVKDISMAVCLLLAVGLAAGIEFGWIRRKRLAIPAIWLFFVSGAFMRANSLFGLPPLFELAAGASSWRWTSLPVVRRAVIACLIAIAVAPGHLIADRYIFRVKDIHPISQLQVFDLGGITFNSGSDAFKGFFGPDFVQRNATCYTPRYWDVYGWGGCPEVYENLKPHLAQTLGSSGLRNCSAPLRISSTVSRTPTVSSSSSAPTAKRSCSPARNRRTRRNSPSSRRSSITRSRPQPTRSTTRRSAGPTYSCSFVSPGRWRRSGSKTRSSGASRC